MKKLLILLIILSVIGASISGAKIPPHYEGLGISLLFMVLGIILLRKLDKNEKNELAIKNDGEGSFYNSIRSVYDEAMRIITSMSKEEDYTRELEKFQANFLSELNERLSLFNHSLGIKEYARLMIPYAQSERQFNRSLSAARDGYMEESIESFRNGITILSGIKNNATSAEEKINGEYADESEY